ncbi:MAG: ATP-binding protein [Desulforhopalus sp.]|nr:ATP-binding protein [Desulforhopalus sp.]
MIKKISTEKHLVKKRAQHTFTGDERLNHDLHIQQIELETQNDALRATNEQLKKSLAKYSDLYDFAPVGYITSNRDGLILETNITFTTQLDTERAQLINTQLRVYTSPEDCDRLQAHLEQVFTANARQSCELLLETRHGRKFYAQLDSIPATSNDGAELCRTSVTDISVRRDIESELVKIHEELERRVEERTAELFVNERKFRVLSQEFQALLNAITDTLILFSPEMKVLWTNSENAGQLHETEPDEAAQYCYQLIHDRPSHALDSPIKRCFKTGEKEVAIATYHGAVLDLRAFPIKETNRVNSVLLLVSDITEKMAMQAEAMQAGHMASLGELASGVAHEINNPITGIINYGQILINECAQGSIERDIGERIVKEGDRIGRIVRTLLSYARDGREEKIPISVAAILEESIILTQAQIRKEGINLQIHLPDDLPVIHANLQQIQQSFINIINNARYALNEKYPGRHENKCLSITGEKMTVGSTCPSVRIVFHDHGGGIAAQEMPMVTKQFFSTKPFGKGTGLGLHITDKIIKDHGGQLSFESNTGQFTKVIIVFPACCRENGGEQ